MLRFETPRAVMRPLAAHDESLYCDLYTDAETMRYICAPLTLKRAARTFRDAIVSPPPPLGPVLFAMEERSARRTIGVCGLVQFDQTMSCAELGMILLPLERARGYATEILKALVGAAFASFPITRVWVQYAGAHVAAERLVVAVGFRRDEASEAKEQRGNRVWAIERSAWTSSK